MRSSLLYVALLACFVNSVAADETPAMTRDELIACLADDDALQARQAALITQKAPLDAELADLRQREANIAAAKLRLDDRDAQAITAYNTLIDDHAQRAEAFNAKLASINSAIAAMNDARAKYDTTCANRAYDERDLVELRGR